ncbi:unnamed protein product [Paramecium primaurelia]|uniref:Uncharacterized protein n=1 Tax=Paramecium primaurelia TaxID=5886 RepID=A0A8S1PCM9_PARPR|nr:unnamed protein product [Paramecium primaurelia]
MRNEYTKQTIDSVISAQFEAINLINKQNKTLLETQIHKQLTQQALQTQYTDQLIIDQLDDIRDVINQKIVKSYQYLALIKNVLFQEKLNKKTMIKSVIEIIGNRNMIYLEIHKQLQHIFIQLRQFQNLLIGLVIDNDQCFLQLRTVQALTEQIWAFLKIYQMSQRNDFYRGSYVLEQSIQMTQSSQSLERYLQESNVLFFKSTNHLAMILYVQSNMKSRYINKKKQNEFLISSH